MGVAYTSSWSRMVKQKLRKITSREICIKIFCEFTHIPETKWRQANVTNITKHPTFCRFSGRRIFFVHAFCDADHFIKCCTPYIYVTEITQISAIWTRERFSARFHSMNRAGLPLPSHINEKPRAVSLSVNIRRGVLCHPILRSKYKALVASSATW